MSISIKRQAEDIVPVYNPVILVLDSTKKTEDNFKFIVDVKVNGTILSRMAIYPNLDGYGVVDLHRHLESSVSHNVNLDSTLLFNKETDSFIKYNVELSEQYTFNWPFSGVSNYFGNASYNSAEDHNFQIGDIINVENSTIYDGPQVVALIPSTKKVVCTSGGTGVIYTANASGDAKKLNDSVTTFTGSTVMSGTPRAFNGAIPWVDVPNWKASGYTTNFADAKMLTSAHDNMVVKEDDRILFNFFNIGTPSTATVNSLRVLTYDAEGNNIGIYTITNPYSANADANKFLQVGVGPWNLNHTTSNVNIGLGEEPIINSFVQTYEVHLYNAVNGRISKSYTFEMKRPATRTKNFALVLGGECNRFEDFRMVYLDKYGSWMNISFDLAHKKNRKVKTQTYLQNYGGYNPTTNTWGYNSWDRGVSNLDTEITDTYRIMTDYVKEEVGDMVADLIASPEVYHLSENKYVYDYQNTALINTVTDYYGLMQVNTSGANVFLLDNKVLMENFNPAYGINGVHKIVKRLTSTAFVIDIPYQSVSYLGTEQVSQGVITGNNGGILRAVNIDTSSVEVKQRQTDKMINYNLSFSYANKDIVQRG